MSKPIYFYGHRGGPFSFMSNFYHSPIKINSKIYSTVEHFFQASKATTDTDHTKIRKAKGPHAAKNLGRHIKLRRDWETIKYSIMVKALIAKFTQHEYLRKKLLNTGNALIYEDSPYDKEWGWYNGNGKNLLGKALVDVRKRI